MEYRVSFETTSPVIRQMHVEVNREAYNKRFQSSLAQTARKVSMKGFRPGKVPPSIVQKMYGNAIREEVLEAFFQEAFKNAVKEHQLQVIGIQSFKLDETNNSEDLKLSAELALVPEPEIKNYLNVKAQVELESFNPEQIEERIEFLREVRSPIKVLEGRETAENGDVATIGFTLKVSGEPVDGVVSEREVIRLGKGRFHEGVEAGILGMRAGETKEITTTLPDDFIREELAGKEGTFVVTLKELNALDLPELNDEFAKETGYGTTVAELRTKVEEELRRGVDSKNRDTKVAKILEQIIAENQFDVPQLMVDHEIRQMLAEEAFVDAKKVDLNRIDVTRFRDLLGKHAEERVRRGIILQQIEKQEKLEVTRDEVRAFLERRLGADGTGRSLEDALGKNLDKALDSDRTKAGALREKTLDLLLERSQLSEGPAKSDKPKAIGKEKKKKSAE